MKKNEMKTEVNGVEITPEMAEALKEWYDTDGGEAMPEYFIHCLSHVQDCMTRYLIGSNPLSEAELKDCVSEIIFVKDELKPFVLKKEAANVAP
jgi:hypothetical protein